jgi:hypothetical protein
MLREDLRTVRGSARRDRSGLASDGFAESGTVSSGTAISGCPRQRAAPLCPTATTCRSAPSPAAAI